MHKVSRQIRIELKLSRKYYLKYVCIDSWYNILTTICSMKYFTMIRFNHCNLLHVWLLFKWSATKLLSDSGRFCLKLILWLGTMSMILDVLIVFTTIRIIVVSHGASLLKVLTWKLNCKLLKSLSLNFIYKFCLNAFHRTDIFHRPRLSSGFIK